MDLHNPTLREVLGIDNTIGTRFLGFTSKPHCALCWICVAASTALLDLSLLSASVYNLQFIAEWRCGCSVHCECGSATPACLHWAVPSALSSLLRQLLLLAQARVQSEKRCQLLLHHQDRRWNTHSQLMFVSFISNLSCFFFFFLPIFSFYFIFYSILLYNTVLVLPYINMNPPWVYMCSQSWTPLPLLSPYHLSGLSQCTSPKHPVSRIELRLVIRFLYDIIHVSMPFSQIIPPSPSPTESKSLFYTSVSLLLSHIQGYRYHLSKFHICVSVYYIGVFLSDLLHSV